MNTKQKELIKYIFDTEYKEIDRNRIAENKGLSALCLLYKTKYTTAELTEEFGVNIQFNNISTNSVPDFIYEISKYCDVKLYNDVSLESIHKKVMKLFQEKYLIVKLFITALQEQGNLIK